MDIDDRLDGGDDRESDKDSLGRDRKQANQKSEQSSWEPLEERPNPIGGVRLRGKQNAE